MKQACGARVFLGLLLAARVLSLQASEIGFGGSVGAIHTNTYDDVFMSWTRLNKLHGRIHAEWRPSSSWTFFGSKQYRMFQGEWSEKYPGFTFLTNPPNDCLNLTYVLAERNQLLVQGRMDQAYVEYSRGRLTLRGGRQRIDLGQTLVWNVSDVFNNVSFFELDPMEVGSCDALRLAVFPTALSSLEAIIKMDGDNKVTGALVSRFNLKATDVHIIGGTVRQEDYFFGAGSTFSIDGLNIRSELAYHKPRVSEYDERSALLVSAGLDYLFKNQMMVQGEVLYMKSDDDNANMHFLDLLATPYSSKRLSISKWSYVANWHYVRSPKMSVGFTLAHFPDKKGFLLSPSLDYLIIRDVSLALKGTYFSVDYLGIKNEAWLVSAHLTYYF